MMAKNLKEKKMTSTGTNLPAKGYRIPAEWEEHEATWLGWPHNNKDWPGKFSPIPWVYGEIARKIAPGEKVRIVVESKEHEAKARRVLQYAEAEMSSIEFFILETDRGWMRDSGPAFIKNESTGETAMVNFDFNAWAKYSNFKKDRKLPEYISKKLNINRFVPSHKNKHVVLEGGSIDINGKGSLITTEECLLDQSIQVRNAGFTKSDYETIFKNYLGITNVIWLGNGITGDDTHGHVDDLCRFVNSSTLAVAKEENSSDENYKTLKENRERLEDVRLENGKKPEIIELPMPAPLIFQGTRLPASYANFYFSNNALLVPTFNDVNDKKAMGLLSEIVTDRPVIGIHSVDLVWGFGTLHCLTHEQPE